MAGFMVGGVITLRYRPRRMLFAGTAFLTLTAFFPLAMALGVGLPVILLGAFVHGLGLEIFSVNWDLAIQQNVPPDKLARVFAFDQVGSFVMRPLGLALVGPVAEAVGVPVAPRDRGGHGRRDVAGPAAALGSPSGNARDDGSAR